MELRNGPVSIFQLFFSSLKTANQAFGSALALLLMMIGLFILLFGICLGISYLNRPLGMAVVQLPVPLVITFLQLVFNTACVLLVASRFEQTGITAYDSFRSSIVPTVYFVITSLILGAFSAAVMFLLSFLHSAAAVAAGTILLWLLFLPFCFTLQALILRNEGPISAMKYSWDLATRNYMRILLTFVAILLFFILLVLAAFCILKAFLPPAYAPLFSAHGTSMMPVLLPLFFVQLSKVQLILLGIVSAALGIYVMLFFHAVLTGLFLTLDYDQRATDNRQSGVLDDTLSVPQRPSADVMTQIEVKQASVRTGAEEVPDTARHLEQVYRAKEHLAQVLEEEEDRMPTILFDEDMAKQLAENEEQMRQNQEAAAQSKENNEPKTIKISDKTL